MKKIGLIYFFIVLSIALSSASNKVLIKANIIRGEVFVTANTSPSEIEGIFKASLSDKGFEVVDSVLDNSDLLFVDVFVYQFGANNPCLVVTIRSSAGTHYFDKEVNELFLNRDEANLKIARLMAARIPNEIKRSVYYTPKISDVFLRNMVGMTQVITDAALSSMRTRFSGNIEWPEDVHPEFAIQNGFVDYLYYCSDFSAIRKKCKGQIMDVYLKINSSRRFELVKVQAPFELTEKQLSKIHKAIAAFPLWIVEKEMTGIVLSLKFS
jgi:hypothetical protein